MRHQRISQEESYLCRCSTTFPVDQKTMKKFLATAKLVSLYAKRFGKGQWSFIGPGSEKKWNCERMLLEFAESGCPIFRATSPLSRGRLKSKGHGKLSKNCAADLETIETIFRIIVSAHQLSLNGANRGDM